MESANHGSNENLSNRSRTSSCNSLERIQPDSTPNASSLTHEGVMVRNPLYFSALFNNNLLKAFDLSLFGFSRKICNLLLRIIPGDQLGGGGVQFFSEKAY